MNTPEQKGNEIPEWSIFDRIEGLEKVALELREKAEATEPTLKNIRTMVWDAHLLALFSFLDHFINAALVRPNHARKERDTWLEQFKKYGMDKGTIDSLAILMTIICEKAEEER